MPLLSANAHPDFVGECMRALKLCKNLRSFVFTPPSGALSAILPALEEKEHLKILRLCIKISSSQTASLVKLNKIEKLELDNASWEVLDSLPRWVEGIQKTLTSLTLFETAQPPELPLPPPTLSHLRHLALEVRAGFSAGPSNPVTLLAVLTALRAGFATLSSVTLKIPELTVEASYVFLQKLVDDHARTLERISFVATGVEMRSIKEICEKCRILGVLSLPLPMREILSFASALAPSKSLHTLVDGGGHITHGPRPALNVKNVAVLMQRVPTLTRIVDDRRLWMGRRDTRGHARVALERQTVEPSAQWFMPPTYA
ncbi:hypothetical protein H0H87_009865 [Tephrocybe sp. NHM501043]|nr:hypothetical protein H0H87_009865 [Tephrocybe sp. NHM501043]